MNFKMPSSKDFSNRLKNMPHDQFVKRYMEFVKRVKSHDELAKEREDKMLDELRKIKCYEITEKEYQQLGMQYWNVRSKIVLKSGNCLFASNTPDVEKKNFVHKDGQLIDKTFMVSLNWTLSMGVSRRTWVKADIPVSLIKSIEKYDFKLD